MLKVHDYAALAEVASADLDAWQEKTVGARPSSTASEFTTTMVGADRLHIQLNASWTNATVKTFDTSIDWRDRQLSGSCAILSGSSQRLGQADDDDCNDPIGTTVHVCEFVDQYTGRGAYSDVTTSADVSNSNPPINGVGSVRSCAPVIADMAVGTSTSSPTRPTVLSRATTTTGRPCTCASSSRGRGPRACVPDSPGDLRMSTTRALADRIANTPYGADTEHRRIDVDGTPDSVTDLTLGVYEIFNGGSVAAYLRSGQAVSIPADKAAAITGQFPVPPGAVVPYVASSATLHFVTASGSTTLDLIRKPLS